MNIMAYLSFNFMIYSFIGWIIEEIYSLIVSEKFQKEGFLIGPFKPMYGITLIFLIICNQILGIDGIPSILLCFLIPTTVEYISGYMLKHIFNKIYWDYSDLRYNIHGFVTLKFSLYWTLLSFIGIYFFQNVLYNFYIEKKIFIDTAVLIGFTVLVIDLSLTLKKYHIKGSKMIVDKR